MNVTLIGMSGVGKSRIGRLLAKRLSYRFIDLDRLIEQNQQKPLQELVDCLGEAGFLVLEEKTVLGLDVMDCCVVSSGGSSVYSEAAMNHLKSVSKVVFLDASLNEIRRRPIDFSTRGIVGLKQRGLKQVFLERQPLYRRYADVTVPVAGLKNEQIVEKIVGLCGL